MIEIASGCYSLWLFSKVLCHSGCCQTNQIWGNVLDQTAFMLLHWKYPHNFVTGDWRKESKSSYTHIYSEICHTNFPGCSQCVRGNIDKWVYSTLWTILWHFLDLIPPEIISISQPNESQLDQNKNSWFLVPKYSNFALLFMDAYSVCTCIYTFFSNLL